MARLRANFKGGTITNAPLTAAATSATSAEFTSLPVVASPDTLTLVLDPDSTNPEIAHVTAHASADNTVTLLRGQEATTAREHQATTVWIHAPTAADFSSEGDALATYMGTNALNDEFGDGVLDAAWVRSDSAGEATHLTWTEAVGVLSAKHVGTDAAAELHGLVKPMGAFAIGQSIQTRVSYAGPSQNSLMAGLVLTDATARGSGTQVIGVTWVQVTPGRMAGIRRMTGWTVDAASVDSGLGSGCWGLPLHLRLTWVAANSFQFSYSADGISWISQAAQAYTLTPTHLGFVMTSWAGTSDFAYTFDYFRVVS